MMLSLVFRWFSLSLPICFHFAGMPIPQGTGAALGSIGAPRPGSSLKRLPTAGDAAPGGKNQHFKLLQKFCVFVQAPVGLSTQLNVAARPVTHQVCQVLLLICHCIWRSAQGMRAMPTQALGPGRQIADKSYYLGEIRKKNEDLLNEINS
jgi:hypothetical protein